MEVCLRVRRRTRNRRNLITFMEVTVEQKTALLGIAKAIVETINETPSGAPGGILYAALMAHGCTLGQFEWIMAALVSLGKIRKSGDCYYPV